MSISEAYNKNYKICDVLGGLDVTRLVSTNARNFFSSAIDDVELMREYLSEVSHSGNWTSHFSSLEEMAQTLDWQARQLAEGTTSVQAGLGYTDDRPDRRVDRYAGLLRGPLVGDKESDFAMMDSLSPLLPWIVDRKSKKSGWWKDHQNGKSEGEKKEPFVFESLYTAAWLVSYAEVVMYYPPLAAYGHPLTMGDVVGGDYDSHGDAFIVPNLPENNAERKATFTAPYPDTALEGVALITATAPVYFTGNFMGHKYQDTFVASLGVDMKVSAVSAFLDVLQDSLTRHSFGLLVDSDFNTIVISREVVRRIYPERTGFEEERVTYDLVDGSIVQDRRNQTYLPSDTILQKLTKLENADWVGLRETVRKTAPGEREFTNLNVTLTGETSPTEFHVMYEHWEYVADWALLVFAPTAEVANAINVYTTHETNGKEEHSSASAITMEGEQGDVLRASSTLVNGGSLDVKISLSDMPSWVSLDSDIMFSGDTHTLRSGESLHVQFQAATATLATGTQSDSIRFEVQDADYPDCFFREPLSIPFSVKVMAKDCGSNRVADTNGNCICDSRSVALNGGCMAYGALAVSIVIPLVALTLVVFYIYTLRKRRMVDTVWEVDPSELEFATPPVIIGEGSFGHVLLADYRGTSVAVKTIRRSRSKNRKDHDSADDSMEKGSSPPEPTRSALGALTGTRHGSTKTKEKHHREYFVKEMRVLSKLRHPNIVMIMGGVAENRSEPMLVLEYMERGSLFDLLRSDMSFDGDLICSILKDITQGVRFLHNANPQVIHGDLKAQNILIDSKFRAKVADFGLSGAGTPYWMSPELLLETATNTTASDVYAFGVILYEIYARATPYVGEETSDVLQQVIDPKVNKRPPFPATMNSCMAAMMHDCLVTVPEERPSLNEISSRINRFKIEDLEPKVETEEQSYHLGFLNKLFPAHVAQALVEGRSVEPETHDCVTVVYCDIVGFASLSSELAPIKVADLLHRLFDRFDSLAAENDVFKVDMSGGGAWMGATNCVQDQSKDHAKLIAQFAAATIQAASETLIDEGHPERGYVQIQVAFLSGPVLAKVVGSVTPRYSLFGDTINAVTYLAGKSERGRILCSESSVSLLKQQAPEIPVQCKGRIFVVGNGVMTLFWVNSQQ